MQTTPKLNLNKPEASDLIDVKELNKNMDTLDNALLSSEQILSTAEQDQVKENIGIINSNENLLDNWYFVDPINQFGETSWTYSGSTMFLIDRWRSFGGKIDLVSDGLRISSLAGSSQNNIAQYFETDIRGKEVTVSVLVAGVIYSGTVTAPESSTSSVAINDIGLQIRVGYSSGYGTCACTFELLGNDPVTISACKLEFGHVSTLKNDAPPNKAEQMLRCMRYLQQFDGEWQFGFTQNATNVRLTYVLPVPMNKAPKLRIRNSFSFPWVRCNGKQYNITNTTATLTSTWKTSVVFNFVIDGSSLPQFQPVLCPLGNNIFLTAEY